MRLIIIRYWMPPSSLDCLGQQIHGILHSLSLKKKGAIKDLDLGGLFRDSAIPMIFATGDVQSICCWLGS